MVPFFPKQIANKGIYFYIGALAATSLFFIDYTLSAEFIVMGIVSVVTFFFLPSTVTS